MVRRLFVAVLLIAGIGASSLAASAQSSPTPSGTIRIGVLNPTSGSFAVFGEQVNLGINLYFDGIGRMVGGTQIELVFADSAGDPQQALDQARRLIQEENVELLMGIVNSAVVPPIAELAGQEQVPLLVTVGGAQVATGPDRNPYVFRTAMANGQQDRVLGWYAATELGLRRVATFAWDFIVGEERVGGFSQTFTAAGGEIVNQQKPPLGTTDYGPFISQVNPGDIDAIYAFFAGPGALAFMQQLAQFGITPNVQVLAADYFTAGVLNEMGADAAGLVQAGAYTAAIATPENQAFIEAYQANNEGLPGVYVEEGYLGAMVAAAAIEAAGGSSEARALIDALAGLDVTGPAGPVTFDDRGQAVRTVYITRVEEAEGGVAQTIVSTVAAVSQDWTAPAS
jgi:branched-chain amino acid transport system substrate-binding protein